MKKPYQIEAQRAVRQLEEMAADENPAVQMVLPMAEMVGWLRQGVVMGQKVPITGLGCAPPTTRKSGWGATRCFTVASR